MMFQIGVVSYIPAMLHYDIEKYLAFCYPWMKAAQESKFLSKSEPAFLSSCILEVSEL